MTKSAFTILLLFFFFPLGARAINTVATGYDILNFTNPRIDTWGKCRDVSNTAGKDVFVGTRTQGEWWSFLSFPPANVVPAICPITAEYTSSPQKALPSGAAGVTVTESGVAWTSSAWVQVTAATANAIIISGVVVTVGASTNNEFEIDVGKGAAGSETVVATVAGVRKTNASGPWWLETPLLIDNIAAGQRLAVRIRGDAASAANVVIKLTYFDKPMAGNVSTTSAASKVMPSAATGTSVTPSATSWANSNWSQVTAATATAIVLSGVEVFAGTTEEFEVDVGVGAAGSETVVTTLRDNITNGNGGPYVTYLKPTLDNIPAGSRVAVRMRKNGTSVTAWKFKLLYYSSPTGLTLPSVPMKWAPAGANGATMTPPGVAWSNSPWSVLISSAAANLQLGALEFDPGATVQFEIDLGVGATGSEVVIGTYKGSCSNTGLQKYSIPLQPLLNDVPVGSQLSARIRVSTTSVAAWKADIGYFESTTSTNVSSAYEKTFPSAVSEIYVTPANTSWASSAWTQMSAGDTNQILISSISFDPTDSQQFEVDVGTGAAGSESVVSTLAGSVANQNGNQMLFLNPPLLIAANNRISLRMRKNGTTVTTWGFSINYVEFQ